MNWNEKVSNFFCEYVSVHERGLTPQGNLSFTAIRHATKLLLDENVFASKLDMKKQALKDYSIILLDTFFEEDE